MSSSLIAIAQLNPIVGDLAGNASAILQAAQTAQARGARLLLTSELSLCGYQPQDLLLRPAFVAACEAALAKLAIDLQQVAPAMQVLVGHPTHAAGAAGGVWDDARATQPFFNAVSNLKDGQIAQTWRKQLLPNYGVFDEQRYFLPAEDASPELLELDGISLGVLICEDAWRPEPALAYQKMGAQALLVLNASPYHLGKPRERILQMQSITDACGLPLIYAHLLGGQDDLLFDGASFALAPNGDVMAQAACFAVDILYIQIEASGSIKAARAAIKNIASDAIWPSPLEEIWRALVLGLQDYVRKNGFKGVLLGLSGGIDSALVLALAVDALGAAQVRTVMLQSPYTAEISWIDAAEMAKRMGVRYEEIPIAASLTAVQASLSHQFAGMAEDVTEENLQARIRGLILMALSNKFGDMVLTTGNKSEYATGYCTLYGDMCGGFAPLKDVLKTQVFALAKWRNQHDPFGTGATPIPERIITRPPSAELRPEQTDQDSLPPYDVLDAILVRYMEKNESVADIVAAGFDAAVVERLTRLIKNSEYKRAQSAPGTRVSRRSFDRDWRMPLTNRFLA